VKDLKQSCNPRQMKKHIFGRITGPIIVLAVHLCGTLSIKAVDMFNNNENVKLFALKPCCLPKMVYANRGDIFKLGNHEFDAKDVCSNGAFNKKNWDGPPRWHLQVTDYTGRLFVLLNTEILLAHQLTFSFSYLHQPKFDLWAHNLFKGIDVGLSEDNEPTRTNEGLCRVIVSSTNGSKAKDEISIQVAGGM
jgi:hypothetical protein